MNETVVVGDDMNAVEKSWRMGKRLEWKRLEKEKDDRSRKSCFMQNFSLLIESINKYQISGFRPQNSSISEKLSQELFD